MVTLERAVQVVRVNKGLHSLDQLPLVRQLIQIEEAIGDRAAAWEREQDLLTLVRRHPDDIRTVPVLREIADRQMELLDAVLAGKRPPEIVLGCYYKESPMQGDGSCDAGSKSTVIQGVLADAQRNYMDAIAVMLRHGLYGSDDLRALEIDVLRGIDFMRSQYYQRFSSVMAPAYIGASGVEPWRGRIAAVAELASWELPYPDASSLESDDAGNLSTKHTNIMDPYHRGRQSLRRLYAYVAASSGSPALQADAVVQLADWDLLHSHNSQALDSYRVAQTMLDESGAAAASVDELFAPPTPVVLPAFEPNPLEPDETRTATGHIDVAFEITKYGLSRGIEIVDEDNATLATKRDLLALIRSNRYRPQLIDGQFAAATPVRVRYYLY
jgi:hypothetical protein